MHHPEVPYTSLHHIHSSHHVPYSSHHHYFCILFLCFICVFKYLFEGISHLQRKVADMKASDTEKLQDEYTKLIQGLNDDVALSLTPASTELGNPLLPEDILNEAMPGGIRRAEHFVAFLKKVVEYMKHRMRGRDVEAVSPLKFIHDLVEFTGLDRKPLKFTYSRLNSLLRTLEITALDEFRHLADVANFATLLATYLDGFSIIFEPEGIP